MADISTLLVDQGRSLDTGLFLINRAFAVSATEADNGDRIGLFTVEHAMRLFDANMAVSATLGAAATVKLQRDRAGVYTDLTAATTAAGADNERMSVGPLDLAAGDKIVALVGGGDIGAAATLTVDLAVQRI